LPIFSGCNSMKYRNTKIACLLHGLSWTPSG
jgi:hypothetical protein